MFTEGHFLKEPYRSYLNEAAMPVLNLGEQAEGR